MNYARACTIPVVIPSPQAIRDGLCYIQGSNCRISKQFAKWMTGKGYWYVDRQFVFVLRCNKNRNQKGFVTFFFSEVSAAMEFKLVYGGE